MFNLSGLKVHFMFKRFPLSSYFTHSLRTVKKNKTKQVEVQKLENEAGAIRTRAGFLM